MSDYLTIMEVAQLLRVGRVTTKQLLKSGELRGRRIGRMWRIHRADLEHYMRGASAAIATPAGTRE